MSNTEVTLGFHMEGKALPVAAILPSRMVGKEQKQGAKYAAVLASMREVGLIEPPVVFPIVGASGGQYLLLDGHLRVEALKDLGAEEVFCLISTDDEGYTYNHKVNRLVPIQEHFMITRALERGVTEERIASALKVDVQNIRLKRNMLNGICPEAVELLKDKPISVAPLGLLRRVKSARQIEIAEMLNLVGNYGCPYIQALIAATPQELLTVHVTKKPKAILSPESVAQMQREMEALQGELRRHEDSYGENFLNLVIVRGYLAKLVDNTRVERYLSTHHEDYISGFQKVITSASLDE